MSNATRCFPMFMMTRPAAPGRVCAAEAAGSGNGIKLLFMLVNVPLNARQERLIFSFFSEKKGLDCYQPQSHQCVLTILVDEKRDEKRAD